MINPPLFSAASNGNVDECRRLIEEGATVNIVCGENRWLPIHAAAASGHAEVIKVLIQSRSLVDPKTLHRETPFILACQKGHAAAARVLLDSQANKYASPNRGWNGLHVAAAEGHISIIELYTDWPELIDLKNEDGATAFFVACQVGSLDVAKRLLELGADPLTRKVGGPTALHAAVEFESIKTIELLRHYKQLINAQSFRGTTPLDIACSKGNKIVVQMLLDAGADPNAAYSEKKNTPLHLLASGGYSDCIGCFRGLKVNLEALNVNNITPFEAACCTGKLEAAKELISLGANSERVCSKTGETPVHLIAFSGHAHMFALFKNKTYIINLRAKNGVVPLHFASHSAQCVEALLDAGASIRYLPNEPLLYRLEIIDLFLRHQQKRMQACRATAENIETILDLLIDHAILMRRFNKILPLNAARLDALVQQMNTLSCDELWRAAQCIPSRPNYDRSKLYNDPERLRLGGYIKNLQLKRLNSISVRDGRLQQAMAEHREHLETLGNISAAVLYRSSCRIAHIPGLEQLHALNRLIFQKCTMAEFEQILVESSPSTPKANAIAPAIISDAEFDSMQVGELLMSRYGLTAREIKQQQFIKSGLILGRDLRLIGVGNTFQNEIRERKVALETWLRLKPLHESRISLALRRVTILEERLSGERDVDELAVRFGNLAISAGMATEELLAEVDSDSCLILIDMFIESHLEAVDLELNRTESWSLSEYVSKTNKPFSPHFFGRSGG